MYQKKLLKKFVFSLLTLALCLPILLQGSYAQYLTVLTEDINLPKELDGEIRQYTTPKSLVLVPIVPPTNDLDILDTDLYKGLYYYQVTRFNLPSISFHYVITEDGKLIKSDYSIPDRKIDITNEDIDSPIVVGYISKPGSIRFDPLARGKVGSIILDIINENAIPLENVFIRTIKFFESDQRELKISFEDIFIGWKNDFEKIIEEITPKYVPVQKTYSVEIVDLELPTTEEEIGSIVEGVLTIKNTSKFVIYGGTDAQLMLSLTTDEDEAIESRFFINDQWLSQSQLSIMNDDELIMPNEEKDMKFQLMVPFDVGTVSESFEVVNLKGETLSAPFDVAINIKKSDTEIVEIGETDTGYLKVRASGSLAAEEITRVSPGQRYYVIGRENGWVHIKIREDMSGWVYAQYTKKIE